MVSTERFVLLFSLVMVVVFTPAMLVSSIGLGIEVAECLPVEKTFTEGRITKSDDHTFRVYYVAGMWSFDPAVVEALLESELDIFLTSKDVVHGLHISGRNVNLMAVPGTINSMRVKCHNRGEYNAVCLEYCGNVHQNMLGKIIVK